MERLTTRCSGYAVMAWEHEEKHTTQEWIDMLTDRLAAYEDTGLEPEQVIELKSFTQGGIHKVDDVWKHVQDLLQAEQDGKLVVLPCGTNVEIARDGYAFKADHWSHILTAFRDAPENKSGKQVALFCIKEVEAALKGGEG